MKRVFGIGMLLLLMVAVAVGLWAGGGERRASPYQLERASMSLQLDRAMLPFRAAFRVLLGGVVLFTLSGMGWGAVRWLNRRADTVYPDQGGLYPIREGRVGRAKVFHDPNRTLSGTTVYAPTSAAIDVLHPLPRNRLDVQRQVTGQAQASQALRAAVSGASALPSEPGLALGAFDVCRTSRPLPEVRELDLEPSHIERLLLEDGVPSR
jgi:hypothetical protein